ncbi:MAG TPA: universal stress protein [Noviherbaspirillum sp.]|uniref:universal stress protein n=1 Tax=Noviherbaspirillum sp. TaxID=1926288 RepID=UPI002D6DFCE3|nr:universal stress protein [Noviherbaspirillum sp.]HYD94088.1 universal stress protein [Noviherbaspirillum sp.]
MSYKTILVHVDESSHASERIKIAAAIAMTENAHLIGTAVTGASRYLPRGSVLADVDPRLSAPLDFLQDRAIRGLEEFESAVQMLGLPSFEKRLVDDEAGGGICLQARYADLVVIGQNDPQEATPLVMPDFPQYVVLHCRRPVLLVPHDGRFDTIGKRVLVAWDASMEATRAVGDAIPLLRRAHTVEVATFNSDANRQPGAEIAQYLKRHGIQTELLQRRTDGNVGAALLALAAELGCDLLIMGGYGHLRFREIVLGNATQTVLASMTIPVMMSF